MPSNVSFKQTNDNFNGELERNMKDNFDWKKKKEIQLDTNPGPSTFLSTFLIILSSVVNAVALGSVLVHIVPWYIQSENIGSDHWLRQKWEWLFLKFPIVATVSIKDTYALFATAFICTLSYIVHAHHLLNQYQMTMPQVPSNLPFLGTSLLFLSNSPWDLMQRWHKKYGPIYAFPLLGRTCIAIEDPVFLKEVLQTKIAHIKKDVQFAYKPFLSILGKGIVTSEGKSWMKQRLKISKPLKTDILEIIPRATLEAVQRLYVKLEQPDQNIDLGEELRHLTLQVISNTFMGLTAEESDTTFAKMYLPIVEEANKQVWSPERQFMIFMPFWWNHRSHIKTLNSFMETLIQNRWKDITMSNIDRDDVLDLVLKHYKKENPNTKVLGSEDTSQLRDEFKTFLLAGHETSAAMMTWAMYELMQNDELMEKITKEAEEVFGKGEDWSAKGKDASRLPSNEQLSKLVFSEACLKEALRKYSVVPTVSRRIVKSMQVGPHELKNGDTIMISIQSVHNNSSYWENPEKYDPTRFLPPNKDKIVPFSFLPFIEGPRNCLGQYLALLESKMVLSLLAQRFKLSVKEKTGGLKRLSPGYDPRHRYMVPLIPHSKLFISVQNK